MAMKIKTTQSETAVTVPVDTVPADTVPADYTESTPWEVAVVLMGELTRDLADIEGGVATNE